MPAKAPDGSRFYVESEDTIYIFDGFWKAQRKTDYNYIICKIAYEYKYSVQQCLSLTLPQAGELISQLPRLSCEHELYTAIAFNDPQKLSETLEKIEREKLSHDEKWDRIFKSIKAAVN